MNKRWFTLRELIVSNKHLRIIRNDFKDYYYSTKYRIHSMKFKLTYTDLRNNKEPEIILTKEEINEKYEYIKNKNLSLINLHPFEDNAPLISIIILNRNGYTHLKRLFKDFEENIQYPSYEIILMDNASTDKSRSFLKKLSNKLPLTVIRNTNNKSFSQANNQAAGIAKGEFLLLLNNNLEPTYGWLNQMMQAALKSENIGAVGAKLVYPDCSKSPYNNHNSFKTQHEGIVFKEDGNGLIKPYKINNNEPFGDINKNSQFRAAVTALTLLVKKDKYLKVNGFDERYNNSLEDVDICLKFLKKGYNNIYCSTALLFNYKFENQITGKTPGIKKRELQEEKLFQQEWDQWLRKQFIMDKIYNNKVFSEKSLNVAFLVTDEGENVFAGDYFTASELGDSLKEFGWNISFLTRKGLHDWYDVGSDVDILISMLESYDPRKIRCSNRSLIKIAWPRNWFERWIYNPGLSKYDFIFASSETACNFIEEKTELKTFLLPIATNPNNFNNGVQPREEFVSDYCFTGSYWGYPRDIIEFLDPDSIPYKFKLFGKNWEDFDKFKLYYQGFINYFELPKLYASTKIVIDDVNRGAKNFGAVNSRVYDALACGILVLTNGVIGAEETFKGKLPVFHSKEELNNLIEYYLSNEDERILKVKELQKFVLENHTYYNRAKFLKKILIEEYL